MDSTRTFRWFGSFSPSAWVEGGVLVPSAEFEGPRRVVRQGFPPSLTDVAVAGAFAVLVAFGSTSASTSAIEPPAVVQATELRPPDDNFERVAALLAARGENADEVAQRAVLNIADWRARAEG